MKRMVESEIADILNEKLQIDENGIDLKDNLHVDGKISGGEIVEDMSGYSFTKATSSNGTIEYLYAGAVKNGNKLTFVISAKFECTTALSSGESIKIGSFAVPDEIADKLVPFSSGALDNVLDIKSGALNSYVVNYVATNSVVYKTDSTLTFYQYARASVAAGNTYFTRIEVTFLLNDSLVPQN